jgi:hypothetical protein
VIAFGIIHLVEDPEQRTRALYGLIAKYFPGMQPGVKREANCPQNRDLKCPLFRE